MVEAQGIRRWASVRSRERYALCRANTLLIPKSLECRALRFAIHEPLKKAQRVVRQLPHDPRCKLCYTPSAV